MVTGIILAAAVVGILGILIGIFLGVASEKFKVEVDEREILVRNELPGNNCGGCGYAGCDALAKAIAAGQADVGACPVGGASAPSWAWPAEPPTRRWPSSSAPEPATRQRCSTTTTAWTTARRFPWYREPGKRPALTDVWATAPA